MKPHLQYARYIILHKYYVFIAGLKTKASLWRLIIHDWSKFSRAEWRPYVEMFYGPSIEGVDEFQRVGQEAQDRFDRAWLHHQHRNMHHWQSWVLREDSGSMKALEMPEPLVREMVADWAGAGRAITGRWEVDVWYESSKDRMTLHPRTRQLVEKILAELD